MNIKARIDIDFKHAMEQADELEELSGRLCDIGKVKFDDTLTLITRAWNGQNCMDYTRKAATFRDSLYESAEILKNTAVLIRNTAQFIYAAEMAAISISG